MKYFLILSFCFGFFIAQGQKIVDINDFSVFTDDFTLLGKAAIKDQYMRLTPSTGNIAGAAWLVDQKIDLNRGFETEFEFRVVESDDKMGGGDGFAFVMQNHSSNTLGEIGDGLGYKGIKNALVLEFDTYNNDEGSRNHIDIAYYDATTGEFRRHATVHAIPEVSDGKSHFARIHYKDGFLTLFLDSYIFPVLSSKMDIPTIIGSTDGTAWFGFTAATSDAHAAHDLLTWSLEYYLAPPDIVEEEIEVDVTKEMQVKSRKYKISVSDHNKVDGDIISLKYGDKWILTEHKLTKKPYTIEVTLTGFSQNLIMYANNVGAVPPNTAMISIDDGIEVQSIKMQSDLESSEAIKIRYGGE